MERGAKREGRIAFEALINIRPRLGNRSILIQDENIRQQVERISRALLGGVYELQRKTAATISQ